VSDYVVSLIRTWVPILVGLVSGWALNQGIHIPADAQVAATGAIIALYYAVVRGLETRWPWVGWLLGQAKAPTYGGTPGGE